MSSKRLASLILSKKSDGNGKVCHSFQINDISGNDGYISYSLLAIHYSLLIHIAWQYVSIYVPSLWNIKLHKQVGAVFIGHACNIVTDCGFLVEAVGKLQIVLG